MRKEDVVAKRIYYPDTSPEKVESTKQPLEAEQAKSDRNLKYRPPEHGRKIISTRQKLSLLLKLFCRNLCLTVWYKTLTEIRFRFLRASSLHKFQFSH